MVAIGVLAAFAVSLLMATAGIFSRRGLQYAPFDTMLFASLVVSAPIFLMLALVFENTTPPLQAAALVALSGIIGSAAARGLSFSSYKHIGPGKTMSFIALSPMFVAFLAAVVLDEQLTTGVAIGTIFIVAGVIVLARESSIEVKASDGTRALLLIPIAAALLISVSVVLRKFALDGGVGPLTAAAINATTALVAVTPFVLARQGRDVFHTDRRAIKEFGIASILMTVAFTIYFVGLQITPASSFFPIIQTQPLFGVTLSAIYLGKLERITNRTIAGALVVVAGAALVSVS
jgi:DME family drug/metabolite transporter